jgi:hypothetical protein
LMACCSWGVITSCWLSLSCCLISIAMTKSSPFPLG